MLGQPESKSTGLATIEKAREDGDTFTNVDSDDLRDDKKAFTGNDETNRIINAHHSKPWITKSQYKKQTKKLNRQKLNAVFNYSDLHLSQSMMDVLNKGLNFSVLSQDLDLTQVLADLRVFDRTMIWREFWFGLETDEDRVVKAKPIFKKRKYNYPRKHKTPFGLKNFINAIQSELFDPKNRNKV